MVKKDKTVKKHVGFADMEDSFAAYSFADEPSPTTTTNSNSNDQNTTTSALRNNNSNSMDNLSSRNNPRMDMSLSQDTANDDMDGTLHLEDAFRKTSTHSTSNPARMSFRGLDDIDDSDGASMSTNSDIINQHRAKIEGAGVDQTVATIETKVVRWLRMAIWLGLVVTTGAVCALVYWFANQLEHENFEEHFEDMAHQFVRGVQANLYRQLQVADLMATVFTSVALETNQVWPFFVVQNYEATATAARSVVGAPFLGVHPLVTNELRVPYEQFTQDSDNIQWINASLDYQQAFLQNYQRSTADTTTTTRRNLLTQFDIAFDEPDQAVPPPQAPLINRQASFGDNNSTPALPTSTFSPFSDTSASSSSGVTITTTDLPNFWNGIYGTNPQIFRLAAPGETNDTQHVYNEIAYMNENTRAQGPPFYPIWQTSPVTPNNQESVLKGINYNIGDQALPPTWFREPFQIVQEQQQAVLGYAVHSKNIPTAATATNNNNDNNSTTQNDNDNMNSPMASLFYPVFDTLLSTTTTNSNNARKVVAVMETEILFQHFFSYILSPDHNDDNANTILAVVSNDCQDGQSYSFQIQSEIATYVGPNDSHQPEFDDTRVSTTLTTTMNVGTVYNGVPLNTTYCPWQLNVYATEEMESVYVTNQPIYYMLTVMGVFIWTCAIFLVYDWLVERRQKKVMKAAKRSDAIVSQLFPNGFRDALYNADQELDSQDFSPKQAKESAPTPSTSSPGNGKGADGAFHADILETFKQSVGVDHHGETNQPMARLYPSCTVFFADIAGFTAWSSARSPVQVFELLETLYGAFDKMARRRRVFKIETIGDCYVAVTGLPQPQPNHVLLMVKFARDILEKLPPILKKLAITLGPDTKNLAMRVGLHSGPVTAGVLRGEKARFQLFGDTVNTAARMESNGKKECIHCSQETADILYEKGKGHWVHPRDERIVAKGKGELQTYWILPGGGESSMFDQSAMFDFEEEDEEEEEEKFHKETAAIEAALKGFPGTDEERENKVKWAQKNDSSIGWIVDLLFAEVKGIAWERKQLTEYDSDVDHWGKNSPEGRPVKWDYRLCNAIFELADSTGQRGTKSWTVAKDKVKDELKLFVLLLAFQYKEDAPFHNLEHACQALMAVEKMLKQFAILLQRMGQRQLNSWVRFTLYLAAIMGDVTGLQEVCSGADLGPKETAASKRHKEFQNSFKTLWGLIMDKRLSALRLAICVNQEEQEYFTQLLVNLVYATDISEGANSVEREKRWEAAFSIQEESTLIIRLQAPTTLEHMSLAAQWTHTMQLWETYKKWNSLLFQHRCDEFENDIISSDPALEWFQQELVMFEKVVIPLLEKLQEPTALGPTGSELLKYAAQNHRSWSRLFLSRT
ncbi:Receptor-type guanylate cyclase gcy [Seminavis robusta]|uniref:Receptor-type guanylate cyclase gcy n=1 Tax=Seminavis robusta TaxID=568900 RepID=A0A9N8EUA8_9STRA|nr:Receptor-type guanylate cyclase gcy [Seminavis robusta]|eukprot:Sro1783_g297250.1 Receptor-type guanylate cyclase gcy (1371) ;mRNA; r:6098-11027